MKNINYILGTLLLAGSMVACSPDEFPGMNEAGIPNMSEYTSLVSVNVDQSTNTVTFNFDAPGVYPVWVIKEGDKEYRSSVNGYSRQFLIAGTYSYKCYVGSRDGVSKAATEGTFTINESRFDISKEIGYLTALPWHVAGTKPAHIACGSDNTNPTGWWSASPGEKAEFGLYDTVLDFNEGGTYTLNGGESGMIYVNKGVTANGMGSYYPNDNNDYTVPVSEETSKWKIDLDGTDLWLDLGENPYFPYIAHDKQWENHRLKIVSISAKTMTLVTENYPNPDGGTIAWQYILTTEQDGAKDSKDLLVGTWHIAADVPGHLGCGESKEKATGWWSASPYDKQDWGVYDCVLTFGEDGTYTFDSGESDKIYVNWGVTVNGWGKYYEGGEVDYNAPGIGVQTSKWTIKDEVINLGENPYFPYIANDDIWNNPEYQIVSISEDQMTLVIWNGGIAWQYILKKDVVTPESILTSSQWVIAADVPGHLGCGESIEKATNWWSASPYDKQDWGVYDCVLTFGEDGSYAMNSGETDMIYVNKDVTVNGWGSNYLGDGNDYNVKGIGTQTSKWSITGDDEDVILNLGENPYFPYIANDDIWNNPEYHIVSISPSEIELVIWNGGIAWHYILVPKK